MSDIRFTDEDEHGEPVSFGNWRDMATAQPCALIDIDTLTEEQRESLIAEMKPYAGAQAVKDGDERVPLPVDHLNPEAPALHRFTANNLPRLMPEAAPNRLALAKEEAISFIRGEIGAFYGLHRTYAQRPSKKGKWRAVTLEHGQPTECERLIDLFALNLAPRLSPLWHATRVLVLAEDAQHALADGDMQAAINAAVTVGESRKALGMKLVRAGVAASGGRVKDKGKANRDAEIRALAAEVAKKNPNLLPTSVAKRVARKPEVSVGERTIREIIKAGNKGS